ncbi:MAG: polysaccharide [Geobacteraceae bacterium]|nr:MAG: polysaccharide [Geobacteraceae bacterium]
MTKTFCHRGHRETERRAGWVKRIVPAFIELITFSIPFLPLFFTPLAVSDSFTHEAGKISGYRPIFKPGYDAAGTLQIAIRRYENDSVSCLLLVNPVTLETSTVKASAINLAGNVTSAAVQDTPFVRAMTRYTSPPFRLQNHGAGRADHPVDGLFLTVDMCPSKRAFERELFETAARLPQHKGGAVPVAIAVTGVWMKEHKGELAWLAREITDGKLAVTWVNHSYGHPYEPGVPLKRNFLLTSGVDFEREVLETEALLLENGFIPSPFFRFPGLVADGRLLGKLRELSLIPIGSDAWLAKGEVPRDGSFVLVHGNGNEPQGIKKALPLLHDRRRARLLPLRRAFSGVAP